MDVEQLSFQLIMIASMRAILIFLGILFLAFGKDRLDELGEAKIDKHGKNKLNEIKLYHAVIYWGLAFVLIVLGLLFQKFI